MLRCPNCGAKLSISLILTKEEVKNVVSPVKSPIASKGRSAAFRINFETYSLFDTDILEAVAELEYPETIQKYYIELVDKEGKIRQYPIKQAVRKALKTKYPGKFSETGFTAHRARDILTRLGFIVKSRY